MLHDTIALTLWSMLALSLVLTIVGVGLRRAWPVFVAATLSFLFGVAAMFSIGIFILTLALIQFTVGVVFQNRVDSRSK